jgi:hypothetical protein
MTSKTTNKFSPEVRDRAVRKTDLMAIMTCSWANPPAPLGILPAP